METYENPAASRFSPGQQNSGPYEMLPGVEPAGVELLGSIPVDSEVLPTGNALPALPSAGAAHPTDSSLPSKSYSTWLKSLNASQIPNP